VASCFIGDPLKNILNYLLLNNKLVTVFSITINFRTYQKLEGRKK